MIMKSIRRERCSFDLEENRRFVSDRDCVLSCCCSPRQKRSLGVICVSMIVFFNVCGGPWGAEQVMSAGGPLIGLIGIFVFAFLLAIPSILMTTELCTMFPTNGGYSIWVKEAFGPFWGFQESWWSWGSGVVDNAIYPVLFFDVLSQLFEGLNNLNSVQQYFIKVLIMMIFALPNFLFVDIVGRWMLVLFVFSMAPFVVFVGAGLFHSESAHNLIETKSSFSDIDFSTLLSVLYWNFSGFDCVSTISGEVKDPARTVFRGSILGWFLMIIVYVSCLSTAVLVNDPNWHDFDEGSFVDTAKSIEQRVGGREGWLVTWLAVASLAAFIGQFSAELMEDSFQVLGVAEQNMLPKILSWKHPRFGTPWINILMQMCIVASLLTFDFNKIVIIDNTFSIMSYLLEVASLIELRLRRPNEKRAFDSNSILSSTWGMCFVMLCPVVLALIVLVSQFTTPDWYESLLINGVFVLIGVVLERYFRRRSSRSSSHDNITTGIVEEGKYREIAQEDEDDEGQTKR